MNICDLLGPEPEPESSKVQRTTETLWSAWRRGLARHHITQHPLAVLDRIERRRRP